MEKTYVFSPKGVCARSLTIVYDDETMTIVDYIPEGGCRGHGQGIRALVKGMKMEDAAERLAGIPCRPALGGFTSCPDQLSKALKEIIASEAE